MSNPHFHGRPSRPTRYRSTNQQSYTHTMAATSSNEFSRPLSRQHLRETHQHGVQTTSSFSNHNALFSPHQYRESSQQGSISSINTRFSDLWPRQVPLLPSICEESPEVVHMKATRLATSLLTAGPFKLKSIDQLYDEAMQSEDEKALHIAEHKQRGLRGVQRSTTRAQPRPRLQPRMERPQERRLTQWPVFPANPVDNSSSKEFHHCPGRIEIDVLALHRDNIHHQAVNTVERQIFRDLLPGRTAWRYKERTANVEYHEYLWESALLANKVGSTGR